MHNLAAYSLQASLSVSDVDFRLKVIDQQIDDWLNTKGAKKPGEEDGSFTSLSGGGEGKFTRKTISTAVGTLREVQLNEVTDGGQTFTSTIQVASDASALTVFATLSVTAASSIVTPVQVYPRCPKVIRTLIDGFDDWTIGEGRVPSSNVVNAKGEENALSLCLSLRGSHRNLPIVVVSVDADEVVWPNLPQEIARDLVGLAHVAVVDEIGSWVLTEELGKHYSCYLGAVRLYWPTSASSSLKGTVWTSAQLRGAYGDGAGMKRFQSVLRRTVMATAALTIAPPRNIRDIQNAATRERLSNLEATVRDEQLDELVEENSSLEVALSAARQEVAALQWKVSHLRARLGESEGEDAEVDSDVTPADAADTEHAAPVAGEIRHYKKIGKAGDADELVVSGKCNHNESSWKPAFKAIQAEKGLIKLEGRSDWKSMQHCSACTGGGRWRVRW